MKNNSFKLLMIILALFFGKCNVENPSSPNAKQTWEGIPNAKAFDNLIHVRELQNQFYPGTSLGTIDGYANLDGTIGEGSAWEYGFGRFMNNQATLYNWDVWSNAKIELTYSGPPFTRSYYILEVGPYLKINSDKAIQLARQYGAEKYITKHPHAIANIWYVQTGTPIIRLWFSDPEMIGECEPQWRIRSDNGEFLSSDYHFCNE